MSANDGERFRASVGTRSVFVPRWGEEIKAFENRCAHRSFPLRNAQKATDPLVAAFIVGATPPFRILPRENIERTQWPY